MNVVAIIQARMASSRLPGKVLLDIAGQPMLVQVVERTRRAETLSHVVVATTDELSDDAIAMLCEERNYLYTRGSRQDVLDRYYQAACAFQADIVVRITADCPIIDPNMVDETVDALFDCPMPISISQLSSQSSSPGDQELEIKYDFAANRLPPPFHRTFPIGLDTEVCTFSALEQAWLEADQPYQREHVMPYLYEVEGRFRVFQLNHDPDYGDLRWTVDTAQDLAVIRRIFDHFGKRNDFSWQDVLALNNAKPEMFSINANIIHKSMNDVDHRQVDPNSNPHTER